MTFFEFIKKFSTEKAAIDYFVNVRYAGVITCPHCGATVKIYRHRQRPRYCNCKSCDNSFSIFTGTIFEHSKLDIRKWFYAVNIFLNDKKGVSACNLQREIGGTYRTSWRMLQQIRAAMGNGEKSLFSEIVEIDETYVGGKLRKDNRDALDKKIEGRYRGRGTKKTPVVGVIERETKHVHAEVMKPNSIGQKLTGQQLLGLVDKTTAQGTTVMTDSLNSYRILDWDYDHRIVNHSKGQYVAEGNVHTNNIENFWSVVKRSYIGVYHKMSEKYLQRYIDEACYRRNNPGAFDKLLKQGVMTEGNNAWRVNDGSSIV
jgi:transposase-like protein